MDDTDLRGLGAADARAYALEFMTALKAAERELGSLGDELVQWAKRAELAAQKGAAELEAAARARLSELEAKRAALAAEREELAAKVARIREKLPLAAAGERSVDPDLLLAQLRMAAGEGPDPLLDDGKPSAAATAAGIAALGADDALAELKRKLGMAPPSAPPPEPEGPKE